MLCPRATFLTMPIPVSWRAARPPTSHRSTLPAPGSTTTNMPGQQLSDAPPVPPLSLWGPETPEPPASYSPLSPHNPVAVTAAGVALQRSFTTNAHSAPLAPRIATINIRPRYIAFDAYLFLSPRSLPRPPNLVMSRSRSIAISPRGGVRTCRGMRGGLVRGRKEAFDGFHVPFSRIWGCKVRRAGRRIT
ncbi:hypothetical protein BS50DRAFT_50705 [Corynespora cassiicola Philippines]|uniref:Uncharacterized protein n=1 Tax=Corynespora cassiicola Philippines TaxID=1448308 RepID=A0A2T2NI11_CORCC|nr:hypothetical protein BS50DRAFT_50705 [Corynespora cassiicola Philippines]